MTVLINIPREFEQHFQSDRFEESLHRLNADAHLLAGNYEQETAKMLIEAFKSAVPANRIQAMKDEELAEWLWFKVGKCPPFDVCPSQVAPCEAKDCWLNWLKQEAET